MWSDGVGDRGVGAESTSDSPGLLRASLPARGVHPAGAGRIVVGEVAQAHDEGSVYVTRRDVVLEQNSLYGRRLLGYPVDRSRSVDRDTAEDWSRAEALLAAVGAR